MKNKTWLWIIFLVLFAIFATWFIFFAGNDAATGYRWWSAKGGW